MQALPAWTKKYVYNPSAELALYLTEMREKGRRPKTVENYRSIIQQYLLFCDKGNRGKVALRVNQASFDFYTHAKNLTFNDSNKYWKTQNKAAFIIKTFASRRLGIVLDFMKAPES